MPLYEFRCANCGATFEKRLSFSESSTQPECPHCRSLDTHKKISSFAAHGTSKGASATGGGSCSSCSSGSCSGCSGCH